MKLLTQNTSPKPTAPVPLHLKNQKHLTKVRRNFSLSPKEAHDISNDKGFEKLNAAFEKKDKQLKKRTLSLSEKREAANEFKKNICEILFKKKDFKTFDKAVRDKLNALREDKLYQHELKQDIDKFTQKKFKEITGDKAPFKLDILTKPLAPSDIRALNKLSKAYYGKAPYLAKYDTATRTSKQIIQEDGFYNVPSQAMKNISRDSRAKKLVSNVKAQWKNIQKEPLSKIEKERKIADYAVKQTHNIFGDYDRLGYEIRKQGHKSDSEKAFDKKHGNRNRDLINYKKGQMVCAQYSNIVAYALKKAAHIDTTSFMFPFISSYQRPGKHEMLFFNKQNALIEATNSKHPVRTVEPDTLKNIIAQKTDIITSKSLRKASKKHKFHIYPVLNKHQENIDRIRSPYIYKRDKEINKLADKEPQNAIRNVILKHLTSSKGKFASPSDIKYIKFLYENEQDFFKKLDNKHPVKVPSKIPYHFVISFPFSHEKAH